MIKHIVITNDNENIVYVCNQACRITEEKIAQNFNEVTCKNCIRINNKMKEKIRNSKTILT